MRLMHYCKAENKCNMLVFMQPRKLILEQLAGVNESHNTPAKQEERSDN